MKLQYVTLKGHFKLVALRLRIRQLNAVRSVSHCSIHYTAVGTRTEAVCSGLYRSECYVTPCMPIYPEFSINLSQLAFHLPRGR